MTYADWNGTPCELESLQVPALDRAFLFGDAVYEVMRVVQGSLWLEEQHFARLKNSLARVQIAFDVEALKARIQKLLAVSGIQEGFIYCQITRGADSIRQHVPTKPLSPNSLLFVKDFSQEVFREKRQKGVQVSLLPDLRWLACDIKSTNLLANVLGLAEAREGGSEEAVFYNDRDVITEGSHTSVFMVKGDTIQAPPLCSRILPGVTRSFVKKLCSDYQFKFIEADFTAEQFLDADEAFLTGTLSIILPIVRVEKNHQLHTIGAGKPGPISLTLFQLFGKEGPRETAQLVP